MGYLPNYPYHMISDREMFAAFIDLTSDNTSSDPTFFDATYPNPFSEEDSYYQKHNAKGEVIEEISLNGEYLRLKQYIIKCINAYLSDPERVDIPDWIYTYMLGEVIYVKSEFKDILNLLSALGTSNLNNEFNLASCVQCYATSLKYISTLTSGIRPPTMFGEPHIIKQLRLEE